MCLRCFCWLSQNKPSSQVKRSGGLTNARSGKCPARALTSQYICDLPLRSVPRPEHSYVINIITIHDTASPRHRSKFITCHQTQPLHHTPARRPQPAQVHPPMSAHGLLVGNGRASIGGVRGHLLLRRPSCGKSPAVQHSNEPPPPPLALTRPHRRGAPDTTRFDVARPWRRSRTDTTRFGGAARHDALRRRRPTRRA